MPAPKKRKISLREQEANNRWLGQRGGNKDAIPVYLAAGLFFRNVGGKGGGVEAGEGGFRIIGVTRGVQKGRETCVSTGVLRVPALQPPRASRCLRWSDEHTPAYVEAWQKADPVNPPT